MQILGIFNRKILFMNIKWFIIKNKKIEQENIIYKYKITHYKKYRNIIFYLNKAIIVSLNLLINFNLLIETLL